MRVALTGLTIAEYFRDVEGQDVLLFIDNIFRFTQAGSEVSALLGRMPSAVGYQPTLATEMGQLQERITSTKKGSCNFYPGYLRAQRMTIQTQLQQQPLLTWILQQTWNVNWFNWVSTQPLIHLLQAHVLGT